MSVKIKMSGTFAKTLEVVGSKPIPVGLELSPVVGVGLGANAVDSYWYDLRTLAAGGPTEEIDVSTPGNDVFGDAVNKAGYFRYLHLHSA